MRFLSTVLIAATTLSSVNAAVVDKFSADPSFQVTTTSSTTTLPSSIQFHPATFSTSFKQPLTASLALAYPDNTACTALTTSPSGQSYTGKVVLAQTGGGCTSAVKAKNAIAAGAIAFIEMACSPESPTFCNPERRLMQLENWDHDIAPTWPPVIRIPVTHINYHDGKILSDALAANTDITVSFKGAGNMPLSETYVIGNMTVAGITFGSQSWRAGLGARAWTGLVETPMENWGTVSPLLARTQPIVADGCQNRLAGVWCEDGHVVGLDLYDRGWHGKLTAQIADLTGLKWFHFNGATLKDDNSLPCELGNLLIYKFSNITTIPTRCPRPEDKDARHIWKSYQPYPSLQYIDATDNHLTELTQELLELPSLTSLDVTQNEIAFEKVLQKIPIAKFQKLSVASQNA